MSKWRRKLATARELLHTQGLRGLTLHLAHKLYRLIPTKGNLEWLAHKDRVDEFFDHTHDIDTRGITTMAELQIVGQHRLYGLPHIASDPDEFSEALASLRIRHEDYFFIDLGSGKGRALLLALSFPFPRIIGVEFAFELHRTAQANLMRFAATHGDVSRISLVHNDAAEFELPPVPLVIYLYNPFSGYVMKKVVDRVLRSYSDLPRPIYIIYANAFLENLWVDRGFTVLRRGKSFSLLCLLKPAKPQ